jgi:hypothetical protein
MAYRTVKPKAFGNARQSLARDSNSAREYTYAGVPPATSTHLFANSWVKKALLFDALTSLVAAELRLLLVAARDPNAFDDPTNASDDLTVVDVPLRQEGPAAG